MRKHVIIIAIIYLFIEMSIGIMFINGHIQFVYEISFGHDVNKAGSYLVMAPSLSLSNLLSRETSL